MKYLYTECFGKIIHYIDFITMIIENHLVIIIISNPFGV